MSRRFTQKPTVRISRATVARPVQTSVPRPASLPRVAAQVKRQPPRDLVGRLVRSGRTPTAL